MACLVALLFVEGTVFLVAAILIGLMGAMVACLIALGCAVLLVLLAFVPTLGTSILAFLVALKALTTR